MFNIFEYCSSEPPIEEAKRRMLELGALGAMMTGSGSAVFGLFESKEKAAACAAALGTEILSFITQGVDRIQV